MPATNFIKICEIAHRIGVNRSTLRRALQGKIQSPRIIAKYRELAREDLASIAAIIGAELPAQTEIRLPSLIASKRLAAQLGAGAMRAGRMVIVTREFSLIPASASAVETSTSGAGVMRL